MPSSTIRATLPYDVQTVWDVVLDVGNYGSWRSDVGRTEVEGADRFVEYTRDGYPTTFTVTATRPCERWEFDMENGNMRGHWTGEFFEKGAATEIVFTERVTAKKLFMRPFVKGFLKKQQEQFVADLKEALASGAAR